jgi:hypothetical protein
MTVEMLVKILQEAAQLEPVGAQLVMALINKLKGKSDQEVLATDATDWAAIIVTAHGEANQ